MKKASFLGCLIEQKSLLGGGDSQLERHRMDHEGGLQLSKPAAPTPCFHRFDADGDYADRTVIFAHSDKGFTTNELATQWLSYFDTWTRDAVDGQQRLLILDGHRTHYSLDFIRYAVQNKITLLSYRIHYSPPAASRCRSICTPAKSLWHSSSYPHTGNPNRYHQETFLLLLFTGKVDSIH